MRDCRIGDICRAVSEGVYVDLQLSLDLGPENLGARGGGGGGAAAATTARQSVRLDSPPIVRYFLSDTALWIRFLADALGNAVSDRFRECGVLRGDVEVTVIAPPETVAAAGGRKGERTDQSLTIDQTIEEEEKDGGVVVIGGGGGGVEVKGGRGPSVTSALVSLHIVNSVTTAKTEDKYAPPKVDRCVGVLASPGVASELTSVLFDELTRRKNSGGGGGVGAAPGEHRDMVHEAFARRVKVVGAGPVALRNAPRGYRKIDNHDALDNGGSVISRKDESAREGREGASDTEVATRNGGSDPHHQQDQQIKRSAVGNWNGGGGGGAWTPLVVFTIQAAAVMSLFCMWVLARRWRSRSRVSAASLMTSRRLRTATGADAAGGAGGAGAGNGNGQAYGEAEEGEAGQRVVMKQQ